MAMLLSSLVNALSSAEDPATVQSFLQVIAFLVNQDAVEFVECLSSIPLQQHNGNSRTAFQVAMEKWMERQMEVRTPYDIRLTTTALASLLLCSHPAIDSLIVKGKRIDSDIGIRTRSRAAQHAEQWNQVPLRVKIVMVLADAYIESKTQKGLPAGDFDNNDEEEWIEDDEDDDDEDDDASLPNLDANGLFSSYFGKQHLHYYGLELFYWCFFVYSIIFTPISILEHFILSQLKIMFKISLHDELENHIIV